MKRRYRVIPNKNLTEGTEKTSQVFVFFLTYCGWFTSLRSERAGKQLKQEQVLTEETLAHICVSLRSIEEALLMIKKDATNISLSIFFVFVF